MTLIATKEENFTEAFDAWASTSKKLIIAEAMYAKVSYPLRRSPDGNTLMNEVFLDMQGEISILKERENSLADKLRAVTAKLQENTECLMSVPEAEEFKGDFYEGDTVKVILENVQQNGGNITLNDTAYTIEERFENGEIMYHLTGINNKSKVFLRENEEYAFIDEELKMLQ